MRTDQHTRFKVELPSAAADTGTHRARIQAPFALNENSAYSRAVIGSNLLRPANTVGVSDYSSLSQFHQRRAFVDPLFTN
jgi:hypothetical protein